MARVIMPGDDQENKQGNPLAPQTGGGQSSAGMPGAAGMATAAPVQPQVPSNQQGAGTGFINLQSILDANKGSSGMIGDVGGQAGAASADAISAYNNAQKQAQDAQAKAATQGSADYLKQMKDYRKSVGDWWNQNVTVNGITKPLSAAYTAGGRIHPWTEASWNDFVKGKGISPLGQAPVYKQPDVPSTISGAIGGQQYGDLQNKLMNAASQSNALAHPGGLSAGIQNVYGNNQLTTGGLALDTFLAGQQGVKDIVKNSQNNYQQLSNLLGKNTIDSNPAMRVSQISPIGPPKHTVSPGQNKDVPAVPVNTMFNQIGISNPKKRSRGNF